MEFLRDSWKIEQDKVRFKRDDYWKGQYATAELPESVDGKEAVLVYDHFGYVVDEKYPDWLLKCAQEPDEKELLLGVAYEFRSDYEEPILLSGVTGLWFLRGYRFLKKG